MVQQIGTLKSIITTAGSQPVVPNDISAFNENFGMMKTGIWHHTII